MTDSIDIMTSIHQGEFYHPDAGAYMNDQKYLEWLRRNKVEIRQNGAIAVVMKARGQHKSDCCPLPIYPGELYFSVQFGNGLGAMKTRDKVHIGCWHPYWNRRKEKGLDKTEEPDSGR